MEDWEDAGVLRPHTLTVITAVTAVRWFQVMTMKSCLYCEQRNAKGILKHLF